MIDFTNLICTSDKEKGCPPPPQYPVSILDLHRIEHAVDMYLPLQDPCPRCGAFNMQVGDYVCYEMCSICIAECTVNYPDCF